MTEPTPRVRPGVMVYARDGHVQFTSLLDMWIKDFDVEAHVPEILRLLDGSRTEADVVTACLEASVATRDQVVDVLGVLQDEGILTTAPAPEPSTDRYDRQRRFLDGLLSSQPVATSAQVGQDALRAAHVVVLGLGGAGGWVLQSLAMCGVGRLSLIDPDLVEQTNLNRQVLFSPSDVGSPKAEATAATLRRINPDVTVEGHAVLVRRSADLAPLVSGADLVINCADFPSVAVTSAIVSETCGPRGIPHIVGGAYGANLGVPGMSVLPGRTTCWECAGAAVDPLQEGAGEPLLGPRAAGSIAPLVGIVGNLIAWEAIRILLQLPLAFSDTVREFNALTLAWQETSVSPRPSCQVCRPLREVV